MKVFIALVWFSNWTLVFRATPRIGIDVTDAWTTGTHVTTDDATCTELTVT
ncbi:hypothetical protein DPMN_107886 [Dreissena polymorpha]|uniref:Uncharacterized protein n=1 Tax=Dreissena polymorpha TaxID=45954 RepID=A0A9D4QKD8_DREPO|nr:hypothetical protein DPMN_107886 [Dreissena polymorpha]